MDEIGNLLTLISFKIPGTIRERATWIYPVYHIFDSVGSSMLKVRGPLCHYGCCGDDVPFIVTR
jgi:hypothetical protein